MKKNTPTPRKGERILTCSHDTQKLHWFWMPRTPVSTPGGDKFHTNWMCICEACFSLINLKQATFPDLITDDFVLVQDNINFQRD